MKNIDIPSHANALWRTLSFGDFTEIGHRQIRDAMEALGEEYRAELLAREDQIERLKGHEMAQKENMQHHPRALAYFENHGVLGAYLGKNWIEALCIEAETLRARLNEVEQTATERVADAEQGERNANTEHAALLKKYENLHAAAIRAINLLPTNGEATLELVRHIQSGGHDDVIGDLQAEVARLKKDRAAMAGALGTIRKERNALSEAMNARDAELGDLMVENTQMKSAVEDAQRWMRLYGQEKPKLEAEIRDLKAHGDKIELERQEKERALAFASKEKECLMRVCLIFACCLDDVAGIMRRSEGVYSLIEHGSVSPWDWLQQNDFLPFMREAGMIASALIVNPAAAYEIGEASILSKPKHYRADAVPEVTQKANWHQMRARVIAAVAGRKTGHQIREGTLKAESITGRYYVCEPMRFNDHALVSLIRETPLSGAQLLGEPGEFPVIDATRYAQP